MGSLRDRHALVTGGGRGIGLACATALAAGGDRVAVTVRTAPPPPGFLTVTADVTDTAAVEAAVAEVEAALGPVQVLVANAGIGPTAVLARATDRHVAEVLDVNVAGVVRVARRVVPGMARGGWGRVVLVSSVGAATGAAGAAVYGASKAALVGLARSLARELAGRGVTVNVVAPGMVDTDLLAAVPARAREEGLARVPAGRVGRPAEVAAAVRWLASDAAGYVTGAVLPVDGGASMGW